MAAAERSDAIGDRHAATTLRRRLLGDPGLANDREPRRVGTAPEEDLSGTAVGAWYLHHLLARGGMGDVYYATAAAPRGGASDEPVAVKVLRRNLHSVEFVRRVQREHALLAALHHPGIVALRDAGQLDDGRPFLVTNYVEGTHLDEYCEGLDARRIVALMADVCRAVHAVHAHGSVHRDLKPTNILVTSSGCPVLLDFGVAARVPGPDRRTIATIGGPPMTPYYASPELLAGGTTSPRTDVFALGIVLRDVLRSAAPSQHAGKRRGCARIVDRSTSVDPADRHVDAGALAADLDRVLAGRRIGVGYCVRRAVRRHRLALAATLAVVVSLGIAAGIAVQQTSRTARATAEAWSVSEFLVHLLDEAAPQAQGALVTLPDAWRHAEAAIPTTFVGKPAGEARVRMAYGRAYAQLGDWQRAATHLERAIELLANSPDSHPGSLPWCRDLLARCRRGG